MRGAFAGPSRLRVTAEDATLTAKVLCRRCNNEWMSRVDHAAANAIRPLIRGARAVELDRAGQEAFAAWVYKTALVFDAAEHGHDGPLAPLRPSFRKSSRAGPNCVIMAGPAPRPPSVDVGTPKETVNLWMLGVRSVDGSLRLTVDVEHPDGRTTQGAPTLHPVPGYQVLVGALCAYLGGRVFPIAPEGLKGFQQVWPASDALVTVQPASLVTC